MVRTPCTSSMEGMKRGAWTAEEDQILKDHVQNYGQGKWNTISRKTGDTWGYLGWGRGMGGLEHESDLKRSGKSCRLRWLNYLRPDIKRGNFSEDEEDLIIRLHKLLGNRWRLIAGRLPGRTDNEIKNYWNTSLRKRLTKEESFSKQSKEDKILNFTETVPSCCKETKPVTTIDNDLQINASWDFMMNVKSEQHIGSTLEFLQGIDFTNHDEDWFCQIFSPPSHQTHMFSDELLGSWLADQDNLKFDLVLDS